MQWKRLVSALAIVAALAAPTMASGQHADGHAGGGHPGGFVGHGPGGVHFHAPAGGFARGGHFAAPGGAWASHPAWRGGGSFAHWRGGHWWHGNYGGRLGWWWIVGPDWYWYPYEVAAIPDPYTPTGMAPGYYYWCAPYSAYYPYVGACPVPWVPEAMP
jgi:hypothetical protein